MTNTNTPLLTDQYELVMANGYWQLGMAEKKAAFNLFFRSHPFENHYTVCAGLQHAIDFLNAFNFSDSDLEYLATLTSNDGTLLFSKAFLDYLKTLKFSCNVDAIPEGYLIFPNEPMLRITGPLLQCQILETALINLLQFSSVIATKASLICDAAEQDDVVEFGLRRAQGPNGGLSASRAAFIGGCAGTSNVLAGKTFNIPVIGTMAHSWVMAFQDESTSFKKFTDVLASNAVLLVDTYYTEQGVENAITMGKKLRERNHDLLAIRLDSGDLELLSKKARQQLDQAGFENTKIMASGDLNETTIRALKQVGAPIDSWGVGTQLATAANHPYLNAVYKLVAIEDDNKNWEYKLKISDTPEKSTLPGVQQVKRFYKNDQIIGDTIYEETLGTEGHTFPSHDHAEDLLKPIFKNGKCVYDTPTLDTIQDTCSKQRQQFKTDVANFSITLDAKLEHLKTTLRNKLKTYSH